MDGSKWMKEESRTNEKRRKCGAFVQKWRKWEKFIWKITGTTIRMNEWARTNKQQENIKLKKRKKMEKTKTLQKIAIRVQWNSCLIAYQTKPDKQALTHRQLHNEKKTKFRQFSLQWKSFFSPVACLAASFKHTNTDTTSTRQRTQKNEHNDCGEWAKDVNENVRKSKLL